jgi:hypothetical protein
MQKKVKGDVQLPYQRMGRRSRSWRSRCGGPGLLGRQHCGTGGGGLVSEGGGEEEVEERFERS